MIAKTLFFFTVVLLGNGNAGINIETLERNCKSPQKNAKLDKEWVENGVPEGGWYFPLISRNTKKSRSAMGELLHSTFEKEARKPFCPRLTWANGVAVVSHAGKKFVFNCKDTTNGTFSYPVCIRNVAESTDKRLKADRVSGYFTTLTDNKSYMFAYRCWEDGYTDWMLIASEKTVGEETKKIALKEAEFLGFDRNSYYDISHDKCT